MIDLLLIPSLLLLTLVVVHAWFGMEILKKEIIFTDLSIAQFAALGSALSLGFFEGAYLLELTFAFALTCGLLITFATTRSFQIEAFIGLLYIFGASASILVLSNTAEGVEHFKALLANDILFVSHYELWTALCLYGSILLLVWLVHPRLTGMKKELFFFTLLSLTVTSSVHLAGVLVVFMLLIGPIMAASLQRRFNVMATAISLGWALSLLSLFISYYTDLPTGYTLSFIGAAGSILTVLLLSQKRMN